MLLAPHPPTRHSTAHPGAQHHALVRQPRDRQGGWHQLPGPWVFPWGQPQAKEQSWALLSASPPPQSHRHTAQLCRGAAVAPPALRGHRNIRTSPVSGPWVPPDVPHGALGSPPALVQEILLQVPSQPSQPPACPPAEPRPRRAGGRAGAGAPWSGLGQEAAGGKSPATGLRLLLTSCTVCFHPQAQKTATVTPNPPDMQTSRYQNHASRTWNIFTDRSKTRWERSASDINSQH